MALKQVQKPAFENEPEVNGADTAVAETRVAVPNAKETAPTPPVEPAREEAAKAETSTAIAVARSTAVASEGAAAEAKKFQKEFDAMKGASSFEHGNYAVFKGNNGEIAETDGDKVALGRWAQVRLLSWDFSYQVSPGEQGASTKPFVAFSKDGITVDSVIGDELKSWAGKPVAEYLNHLHTVEEFTRAKVSRFLNTACALMATDTGDGPIGKVIQITLSETSITSFNRYQQELQDTARCVSMGLPGFKMPADPFQFFYIREVAKMSNGNTWTKLRIASTLPNKL